MKSGKNQERTLYLIGSLRNDRIPKLAERLREENPHTEVFDDWFAAGPEADDYWKKYEQERSRTYQEALRGYAAKHVFDFDRFHLNRCTHALLVLPAGKSGHMEIMYAAYGVGAKAAILLDPEDVRWDVMYQFIPTILNNDDEIKEWLNGTNEAPPRNPKEIVGEKRRSRETEDGVAANRTVGGCSTSAWFRSKEI